MKGGLTEEEIALMCASHNGEEIHVQTAMEMAQGIRKKTHTDIGISTTGISGPDGGSFSKPVGLVYIGIVTPEISKVKKYVFQVKRHIHREMATTAALNITRLCLEN